MAKYATISFEQVLGDRDRFGAGKVDQTPEPITLMFYASLLYFVANGTITLS